MRRALVVPFLAVLAIVLYSCTNFKEIDMPVGFSLDKNELVFPSGADSQSVKITSGTKWDVSSKPNWVSLQSIDRSGYSPYEWTANISATANDDFNREGVIVFKTSSEVVNVTVTQAGKKGEYVPVNSISISSAELSLTEGESATLTYSVSPANASIKDITVVSSSPSVATVSQSDKVGAVKIEAVSVGTTTITVTTKDGNKSTSCSVSVAAKKIPVTGVSLDKTTLSLTEGEIATLIATVSPSEASDKSVTWSSSNTSIATVSSSGLVSAKAAGSATITVTTTDGKKTASCAVTVNAAKVAVTGISLDKTSLNLTEGETATLTATVLPSNATDKSVTWSSNNNSVATVTSAGVVTAKAAGTATITVTTTDGNKTATCAVTVSAKTIAVTGVSLDKTTLSLTEGDTATLAATVSPSNASDKSVSWSSNNNSVATVTSAGVVTAKAAGTATITVTTTDGNKTASCSVTVVAAKVPVTDVSLDKASLSLTEGNTATLTATITPSNATDKSVTWSSSNTSVATISTSGVVTAVSAGSATITVTTTDGKKTASCAVTVDAAKVAVTGISLDKTSLNLTEGETATLTATVLPSNATDKSVTWSSSNTSVVAVSSSGVVTAKAAGGTTITVKSNDNSQISSTCAVTVSKAIDYPSNTIHGLFSVSRTKKVAFSKGNLWRLADQSLAFSEHQYSTLGRDNLARGSSQSDGSVRYGVLTTPTEFHNREVIQASNPEYRKLGQEWEVLTQAEWKYLLEQRENASTLLFYNIRVHDTTGLLLLPDKWNYTSISITEGKVFTDSEFSTLEGNGAVFIPYSGQVYGSPDNYPYQEFVSYGLSFRMNVYLPASSLPAGSDPEEYVDIVVIHKDGVIAYDQLYGGFTYGIVRLATMIN